MPRQKQTRYQNKLMLAMSVYVGVMLFVWPLVRTVGDVPLKTLIALAPLLPMLYVITLMARRIRDSDELEQRNHLIGLGVATGVVGALSLAGGFLASAQVVNLDGSVLIWVFPLMMACYGTTRWLVARQYSDGAGCDADAAATPHWRVAIPSTLCLLIALVAYLEHDAFHAGILAGTAACFAIVAVASGVNRWRRRNAARGATGNEH
jgi:hypothetical protein